MNDVAELTALLERQQQLCDRLCLCGHRLGSHNRALAHECLDYHPYRHWWRKARRCRCTGYIAKD